MMNSTQTIWRAAIGLAVILTAVIIIWFFFFRSSTRTPTDNGGSFGTPSDVTGGGGGSNPPTNGTQTIDTTGQNNQQKKVFPIVQGPVVGATLIQTLHPTTTLARYIKQEDGHVYDLPLDVAGAVPRSVSNVTIPGGMRALWLENGNAAVMQYLDGAVVKSVYLGFPVATSTNASSGAGSPPTRVRFLPDNITDIAASADGQNIAYMLKSSAGVDGYTANTDGTNPKKVFTLPLSQVLISWPAPGTLLVQTKSTAGVPGMAFSVDTKSSAVTPLVSALGISATANAPLTTLLYQVADGTKLTTYVRALKSGSDQTLPLDPLPEQCVWSLNSRDLLYCAAPIQFAQADYFDLWHQGLSGDAENIFKVNTTMAAVAVVASPGGTDGGVESDILEMSLSPNERYLSFTTKGSRSLWGVRLSQ